MIAYWIGVAAGKHVATGSRAASPCSRMAGMTAVKRLAGRLGHLLFAARGHERGRGTARLHRDRPRAPGEADAARDGAGPRPAGSPDAVAGRTRGGHLSLARQIFLRHGPAALGDVLPQVAVQGRSAKISRSSPMRWASAKNSATARKHRSVHVRHSRARPPRPERMEPEESVHRLARRRPDRARAPTKPRAAAKSSRRAG